MAGRKPGLASPAITGDAKVSDFNQRNLYQNIEPTTDYLYYPKDNISGFPVATLEYIALNNKKLDDIKEKLKSYRGQYGVTDQSITDFFERYSLQ